MFKRQAFSKHGRIHETISEDLQAVSERIEKRCYRKISAAMPALKQPTGVIHYGPQTVMYVHLAS